MRKLWPRATNRGDDNISRPRKYAKITAQVALASALNARSFSCASGKAADFPRTAFGHRSCTTCQAQSNHKVRVRHDEVHQETTPHKTHSAGAQFAAAPGGA